LALLTLAVYWRVGTFDFINYDDNDYVVENPWVHIGLRWESIRWAFTTDYASNWHPLTWISHIIDCQVFGSNPAGHHLVSLAFHIANTVLIFLVFQRMTLETWKSAFVAALFALHPLHIQSVAWVAERKDVLSTFFWFLSTGAYVLHVREKRRVYYAASLIFMACGLMSKPMLVTLPSTLLLLDYWPLKRAWSRHLLIGKIPFFALSLLSCITTFLVQRQIAAIPLEDLPLSSRLVNAAIGYYAYIYKMFWPANLTIFYPHPTHWPVWPFLIAIATLLLVSFVVCYTFRRHRYMLTGWAWFLGTLVPVIGIVQVGSQAYADRYTYVPLVGLFAMLAWGVPDLLKRLGLSPDFAPALGWLTTAACVCVCGWQLSYWKDTITLFERALVVTPYNLIAEVNLGAELTVRGRFDEAIAHYKNALLILPAEQNILADYNYGLALMRKGDNEGAIRFFIQALRIQPHYGKARLNLAAALDHLGRKDEAMKEYEETVKLDPENSQIHYVYATVLLHAGRLDAAEREYRECLRLDDTTVQAYENLGMLLAQEDRLDEALAAQERVLQLGPDRFNAHYNYAATLAKRGKIQQAISQYHEALALRPDSVQALNNLALILATDPDATLRNGPEAVTWAEEALRITKSKDMISLNTASEAYAEAGRFREAVSKAEQALKLAQAAGQNQFADSIRKRIELYRRGMPFHTRRQ
jgi:tetratricopeptide (TPR) repeat protein